MIDRNKIERLMKRCQVGCGGRDALDDAHDILAECYGTLGRMLMEIDRLTHLTACPCAGTIPARCAQCQ